MSKPTTLTPNPLSPVEKLLIDIPSAPRRAGQGLMAYYLTDKSSSDAKKMPPEPDEDLTVMAALSAVTLLNGLVLDYASESQRKEFAQRLEIVGSEAAKHISDETRRAKFDQNIIKNASQVKGFNISKAIDDLKGIRKAEFPVDRSDNEVSNKEADKKLQDAYQLLENVFIEAAAASKNELIGGGRYKNSVKQRVNQILNNRPEIIEKCAEAFGKQFDKDKFFSMCEAALESGTVRPNPLKNITPEEKQKVQEVMHDATNKMLELIRDMNPKHMADVSIKENCVNVECFSPQDKEELRLRLDSVKDLWSVEGMNSEGGEGLLKKRKYLTQPGNYKVEGDVDRLFSKICQELCEVSDAKLVQKVAERNSTVAGISILMKAIKKTDIDKEHPRQKELMEALLPHLAQLDPLILNKNQKTITNLCVNIIKSNTIKNGLFGLMGDREVVEGGINKMSEALKASLAQFQQVPKQDVVARPNSLPAGMPLPSSPTVVDRSKALLKPRPPTTPFPGEAAARPEPRKNQKEQPKVVTAASLEKWEKDELMPHGMPAPESQKANPTKPIPSTPLAVPINRPRSNAIDVGSVQQEDRPSSASPSIVTPPIPPVPTPMRPKSEVPHTSPPAPSELLKKNPILEANERSRREIEGWRSGYESLGFVGRLGVSKRPESHKNLGQSVKAWREWHEDNKEYLAKKKFALPAEYKDALSKLQVAEDVGRVVEKAYNEESRGFLRELKHLDDDAARLSILSKKAGSKRANREAQLRSAPANIISEGDVQEHNIPHPPSPQKGGKVDALNKKREEEGRSGGGGAARS